MRILIFLLIFILSGCSYFSKDEDSSARYWTVERLYTEAKSALDSGYYSKAVEYYQYLETRFPFGVYGQQSLLDLAYAYYKTEDFEASISACNRFIRLYPQNPHVDYAYFLRGLNNFNQGKGLTERFLPIDLAQRDPASALQAFNDFMELSKRFPESQYIDDSRKRMVHLRNILAEHEVHVANYYMRRGAYLAAVNRARFVVENYSRTPSIPEALVIMAHAYKVLEMNDLSADALRVLHMNYPNHPGVYKVQEVEVK